MPSKVMVGARAKVYVDNQLVGIYESCTWNSSIGVEPIHLLGRYGPDEITPTSYEAVTINCSGFRVVGSGVHVLPKFPKIQDLLNLEAVTIAVVDRQTGQSILTAIGCVGTTNSGGYNARAASRVQVNYTGLRISDESGAQDENGAVSLP
jgi:hypothetical protein